MFAIPWHGHTLVGTTDTPIAEPTARAARPDEEIDFILETAALYLHKPPTRDDVLSVFAGIRPLVRSGNGRITAALSRDHTDSHRSRPGCSPSTGGKWTTYRHMAEDTVDQAAELAGLPEAMRHADAADPRACRARGTGSAGSLRLGRCGDSRSARERAGARETAGPGAAVYRRRRSCGPRAKKWRARSRTCSRAAAARSFSTRAPPCEWRPRRRRCSHASSDAMRRGSSAQIAAFGQLARGYVAAADIG